jgi:hypothetical protein
VFLEQIPELFDCGAFLCMHIFYVLEKRKGKNKFEFFKIVALEVALMAPQDDKWGRMTKIFCKFAAVLNCTRK